MFPFGSILTQVPLIILAVAYMLYFGAYALGKSKEIIEEDQPEPKEISVFFTPVSEANTFYYNSTSEVAQYDSVTKDPIVTYTRSYISLLYFDPDRIRCSGFNSFCLFSRPPPSRV